MNDIKPNDSLYFLTLFREDMVRKLTEQALEAIRPAAMETAKRVVKEMEPRLQAYADRYHDALIAQITIKEVK